MTRKFYKNSNDFKRKMANNFFVQIYAVKLLLAFSIYKNILLLFNHKVVGRKI